MPNLKIKDGDGNPKFIKSTGDGTINNPYVNEQKVEISAFGSALPAGSNLIGKVDVMTMPTISFSQGSTIGVSSLPSLPAGSNSIGKVEITNFPAAAPLPAGTNTIGKVEVTNFPTTQTITGTVAISNSQIEIANDFGSPVPVSGSVNISNFPTTQAVTGTVSISNSSIEIANDTGSPVPISGAVSVSNFPATQTVAGTVSISNSSFEIANDVGNPIPVSGSVNISNFPATQAVSGTVAISNSSFEIANDIGNPIPVSTISSTTINTGISNPFSVSSAVSNIAANSNRKGLTIYSPLAFDIFIGVQNTVSSSSYLVKLTQDFNYYEFPYGYTGGVSIVCASGNTGNIHVREFI